MSTGTICLNCRKYLKAVDSRWQCACDNPAPSEDGKHPIDEAFDRIFKDMEDDDPTPWCHICGSMTKDGCDCGPIAENH